MQKEQGNSVIGLIAVAAVAILVGIWIGAKTDIANTEIEEISSTANKIQTVMQKKKAAMENAVKPKMEMKETQTKEKTQ